MTMVNMPVAQDGSPLDVGPAKVHRGVKVGATAKFSGEYTAVSTTVLALTLDLAGLPSALSARRTDTSLCVILKFSQPVWVSSEDFTSSGGKYPVPADTEYTWNCIKTPTLYVQRSGASDATLYYEVVTAPPMT